MTNLTLSFNPFWTSFGWPAIFLVVVFDYLANRDNAVKQFGKYIFINKHFCRKSIIISVEKILRWEVAGWKSIHTLNSNRYSLHFPEFVPSLSFTSCIPEYPFPPIILDISRPFELCKLNSPKTLLNLICDTLTTNEAKHLHLFFYLLFSSYMNYLFVFYAHFLLWDFFNVIL